MKKIIKSTAVALTGLLFLVSFSALKETKTIKVKESQVAWKGHKVTGSHNGTIALKGGVLEFENNKFIGGEFVIDMTTINTTDLEGGKKNSLDGHLKSDDFFGVENHPTAQLKITKVSPKGQNMFSVEGNMTIKGKTNTETFDMVVNKNSATAKLKVDRTKYDVRYGSASFFDNLKDKAIYDEFDLEVNLAF